LERSVSTERVFKLSEFNTLRVSESLSEIPDRLLEKEDFISQVKLLQLLELERTYRRYLILKGQLDQMDLEESLALLDANRNSTMEKIKQMIKED